MQVRALLPATWMIPQAVIHAGTTTKDTIRALGQKLHLIGYQTSPTFYEDLCVRSPRVLEYLPDSCNLMSAIYTLATQFTPHVPAFLRTVIAAFNVLNLPLVPAFIATTLKGVWTFANMTASRGFAGIFECSIHIAHFGALCTALTGMGTQGFVHFLEKLELPAPEWTETLALAMPMLSCAVRISAIPQLMDISAGMHANARLSYILQPFSWRERLTCFLPVRTEGFYSGTPFHVYTNRLYGRAINATGTLRSYQRLYRKAGGSDLHFGKTVRKIEARMNSTILPLSWIGSYQAMQLAATLQQRSIIHVHNQMIGLTANLFALLAIIAATNFVAVAGFTVLSSLTYMAQTTHRQRYIESGS